MPVFKPIRIALRLSSATRNEGKVHLRGQLAVNLLRGQLAVNLLRVRKSAFLLGKEGLASIDALKRPCGLERLRHVLNSARSRRAAGMVHGNTSLPYLSRWSGRPAECNS